MERRLLLVIFILLSLTQSSFADEYCLAFRAQAPYTAQIVYQGECDGKTVRSSTGWFGSYSNGLERFKSRLARDGYNFLGSFSNQSIAVFSKNSELPSPSCLVQARYVGECVYEVDCGNDEGAIQIPFTERALNGFLSAYQYHPIQSWKKVVSYWDATQCKGLDRYYVLGKD